MSDNSRKQAKAQLESIIDLVAHLKEADTCDPNDTIYEQIREGILCGPLSVRVRSGWYTPGDVAGVEEFELLLCWGGPACRIVGVLGDWYEVDSARLEHQDWFEPWQEYELTEEEQEYLLSYCREFYFGE